MIRSHPKRLTPPARPGELLKRFDAPQPRRSIKHDGERDRGHIENVQQLPCLYCGVEPCGEAAHVKMASGAFGKPLRFGKRADDRWILPLCRDDHQNAKHAQHKGSEHAFWEGLGIAPLPLCEKLYAQRGDLVAMRAVVMVAIAERSKK